MRRGMGAAQAPMQATTKEKAKKMRAAPLGPKARTPNPALASQQPLNHPETSSKG